MEDEMSGIFGTHSEIFLLKRYHKKIRKSWKLQTATFGGLFGMKWSDTSSPEIESRSTHVFSLKSLSETKKTESFRKFYAKKAAFNDLCMTTTFWHIESRVRFLVLAHFFHKSNFSSLFDLPVVKLIAILIGAEMVTGLCNGDSCLFFADFCRPMDHFVRLQISINFRLPN